MKLLLKNNVIAGTATDEYTGPMEYITAPADFDIDRIADYQVIEGVPTLPPIKETMWERIKAERDRRKTTGGFQCAGKWFHSDDRSLSHHFGNKDTARDQLEAGGSMADPLIVNGAQLPWKTMDGTWLPLTCQLAFDIVAAGKNNEAAIHKAAEIHKATMEASADPASYDFSTGWPLIYGE